jgi:hypothetical protein
MGAIARVIEYVRVGSKRREAHLEICARQLIDGNFRTGFSLKAGTLLMVGRLPL